MFAHTFKGVNLKSSTWTWSFRIVAGVLLAALCSFAEEGTGTISDFHFRYDFTKGTKVYEHNGCETEPCTKGTSYRSVYGVNGYNTAVHAGGYGSIYSGNGSELLDLNSDWSMAMSVKSADVEKGVLLCLGANGELNNKQVLFCSSSEPGKLHIAICQCWKKTPGYVGMKNIPTSITLSDLGDTTNSFHTLVAVHTISDNIIKLYWDGVLVGNWDSNHNQVNKAFANGFQFSGSHGGNPSGYSSLGEDLNAQFQDVRFFTRALSAEEAQLYATAFPVASVNLNDYFFRYDFSSGARVFAGNDGTDPAGEFSSNVSVPGPDGIDKAVHPGGYGEIADGEAKLNENWTIAMSVKPDDVSKGIFLCLGSNDTQYKKQLLLCSDGEGYIHAAICHRWSTSSSTANARNFPTSKSYICPSETSARFHTLVGVHTMGEGKTGELTLYFDGVQIGTLDTSYNTSNPHRPFANGFQFCSAYGGISTYMKEKGYQAQKSNANVAFLDVRFYTNTWTAAEAKSYSRLYPASYPAGINEMTWANTAGDGSFDNEANWSSGVLPSEGDLITIEAPVDTAITLSKAYSFNSLTISGQGNVTFSGEGSVRTKALTVLTGASVEVNDIVDVEVLSLNAGSSATVTGERDLSSLVLTGKGTFRLDPGEGKTYTMSKGNTFYEGEAVIVSGTVKFGNSTSFGPIGRDAFIRVKSGATLDENGIKDYTESEKNKVILEEGAVFTANPGFDDVKLPPVTRLKLEGNANVIADNGTVSISCHKNNGNTYIDLGAYTLTKTGGDDFFISACKISGKGTLLVQEGALVVTHGFEGKYQGSCSDGTINIAQGATFRMDNYNKRAAYFSVKNLVLNGELKRAAKESNRVNGLEHELTVIGSITGSGTAQMLKMAKDAVFEPDGNGYLTISEEFTLENTFNIDLSDLDLATRTESTIPLFKVGNEDLLPAEDAIVITGKPSGWKLAPAKEGIGYQLNRIGMRVIFR